MNSNLRIELIISAFFIAAGLMGAGYFVGQTLYNSNVALNTADVKGLSEKRVMSDIAHWKIQYTVAGNEKSEVAALYAKSKIDQKKIIDLLIASGFTDDEIILGAVDYETYEYRNDNQKLIETKYFLVGAVEVETKNVQLVPKVRSKINALIAEGLDIKNTAPNYYFTELNTIKPDMLKEATQNARIAANEFAENSGVTVGGIRSASQGNFSILDVGESYGDDRKIEKHIRVVTAVTFYLTK